MGGPAGQRRLKKEYAELARSPPPYTLARPYETNLLETHFILRGPEDSVYAGGEYHGVLLFTDQYPFAPPAIKMFTPSGRFKTNTKICTSMSDFHPHSWNPSWSIASILTGLLSFMLDQEQTTGSVKTTDADKQVFAKNSHAFNLTQTKFLTVFPEYAGPSMQDLPNMGKKERNLPSEPSTSGKHDVEQVKSATPTLGNASALNAPSIVNSNGGPLAAAAQAPLQRTSFPSSLSLLALGIVVTAILMKLAG